MTITRVPLREQVHHAIVGRILREELAPGSRISDSALASELGVSRTPVREALLRLEREGFLESDIGRGFFVKPLSAREVREMYPIVASLEVLAMRQAPPPTRARLAELERINAEIIRVQDDPERRIDLDLLWHSTLVQGCENERLLSMIASLKAVIRRYEYAYMQNAGHILVSTRIHEQMVHALEQGNTAEAEELLEQSWDFGVSQLADWLESSGGNGKHARRLSGAAVRA
jgi:DNA-binding GntR family transcriptional regulator